MLNRTGIVRRALGLSQPLIELPCGTTPFSVQMNSFSSKITRSETAAETVVRAEHTIQPSTACLSDPERCFKISRARAPRMFLCHYRTPRSDNRRLEVRLSPSRSNAEQRQNTRLPLRRPALALCM